MQRESLEYLNAVVFSVASDNVAFTINGDILKSFKFAAFRTPCPERFNKATVRLQNRQEENKVFLWKI